MFVRILAAMVFVSSVVATCSARAAGHEIQWRVENPFRFFGDPADTERHARAVEQARSVLGAERLLAGQNSFGWAEEVFTKTCWDIFRQDHSACGGLDAYVNPRSHRISAWLAGSGRASRKCVWSFRPTGRRQAGWHGQEVPCEENVTFEAPYPAGGRLEVSIEGKIMAETTIRVADLFIVGLGDSNASGEGNPDRPVRWRDDRTASFGQVRGLTLSGYPQRKPIPMVYRGQRLVGPSAFWLSQPCHRSLYSHQLRVALNLSIENPHRAVTFLGLSCSGAEITSGLLAGWKGVERFPTIPRRSQVGEAAVAQCGGRGFEIRNYASSFTDGGRVPSLNGLALERCPPDRARKIDLVLVSVGGNDIGFAQLVAYTILQDRSSLRRVSEIADQVSTPREARARFPELDARFKLLRRAIHNHLHVPWDEAHRIILTAYPKIAVEAGGSNSCGADNEAGMDGFPAYKLYGARAAAAEAVSAELNSRLARIARRYEWSFVDDHRPRFAGRGICAGHEELTGSHSDQLRLPRWTGQSWLPYPPSRYQPYASRQRWMRTSNDAFMTTHVNLFSDIRRQRRETESFHPTDLLKASTFGGAFHPTAEGQAAIADAILPVARRVVK